MSPNKFPRREEVEIIKDGKTIIGSFSVSSGKTPSISVYYKDLHQQTDLGGLPPYALAKSILAELYRESLGSHA